jgi:hypothetical protein
VVHSETLFPLDAKPPHASAGAEGVTRADKNRDTVHVDAPPPPLVLSGHAASLTPY